MSNRLNEETSSEQNGTGVARQKITAIDQSAENQSKTFKHRERRKPIPTERKTQVTFISSRGERLVGRLINISRFGGRIEVLSQTSMLEIGEELSHFSVMLEDELIYEGSAMLVSEIKATSDLPQIGVSLGGDGVDTEKVDAILQIVDYQNQPESIGAVKTVLQLSNQISPNFKVLVADLNTLFQDLRYKLSQEEVRLKELAGSENHRRRLEEQTISLAMALYREDIHRIFALFHEVVSKFDSDTALIHKRYFRANFHPYVISSPFANRSFTKPLGHAGDYGLMVMLYEYADIGATLFDKFLHRFSCNEPAAVANKNRIQLISELIYQSYEAKTETDRKNFKISSVACGPAKEVELFLSDITANGEESIHAVCVDQEGEALDYAIQRLRKISSSKKTITTTFLKEDAVLGIIRKRHFVSELANSDVISCAGLFDYLSDRLATKLIQELFSLLAPGGMMIIGNVSDANPDRFSMDYFMEWNLVLRSKDAMLRLVPSEIQNSPSVKIDVISEPLGLNLFLRIRR